ncbi:MAG: CHAP domain-containing protein [Frankiales bacterium]|nr:CHAP domain-containing protein [Frankiales bacterium]
MTPRTPASARARAAVSLGAALALLLGLLAGVGAGSVLVAPPAQAVVAPVTPTALSYGAPSWWVGDCDATRWGPLAAAAGWKGVGAHRMGASWLGIPVCGPRPWVDGSPNVQWGRAGWGEAEWQCVELAQRFMAQVYGTTAYGANGADVVANYSTSYGGGLVKVTNGTAGKAPVPGDVVSFRTPSNPYGHVGVIAASTVDATGNGTVRMLSQNDTIDGWRTLSVVNWRLQGFGTLTPYGWLHDPAGRGNPLGEGAFVKVRGQLGTWRIVGGAPMRIGTWASFGGQQPYSIIDPAQFDRLRSTPRDGTYVRDVTSGTVYRTAGGAPLAVGTDAAGLPGWGSAPVIDVDHYTFNHLDHMLAVPADGTQICRADDGTCYLVAGGAPLLVPTGQTGLVPSWSARASVVVSGAEFSSYTHLRPAPADGTFLCDGSDQKCYRTVGGAPLLLSRTDKPMVPGWSTASRLTVPHAEFATFRHLRRYPADGAMACPVGDTSCYVFAGQAPIRVTSGGAAADASLATSRAVKVSPYEFSHPVHLRTRPVDGTVLRSAQTKAVYVVRSGVAQYFGATTAADLSSTPVTIDQNAIDNAGLPGSWSHLASSPARVGLAAPVVGVTKARSAAVRWSAPVASSAVASYTVHYRRAGTDGRYGPWITPSTWRALTTTHLSLPMARGTTYCFQVRATNRAGQVGPWSPSHCATTPLDERGYSAASSGWLRNASTKFYGGTAMRTTRRGAWWRLDGVTATRVAVVATTCPGCGSVTVFLGGVKVGVVNLNSPTVAYQQVLSLPAFPHRSGSLTLVVSSPSSHSVQLDGVALTP